jgi:hypothetical protein
MTKCQLSFTTMGLVLAITALAFATVGHPTLLRGPSFQPSQYRRGERFSKEPLYCGPVLRHPAALV